MQTRSLRTLVRVAEVGSFAKAADQLNMTLSALSMQMKALEVELDVTLFDRSVRPPRLTPIGRSIVTEAMAVLNSEEQLLELCRPNNLLTGKYRMGFVTSAAVRLLPGFLEQAKRDAPDAAFEFETGLSRILQDKVAQGALDAAIVTDADGLPDALDAFVLRREPMAYAVHRDLLKDGFGDLINRQTFFHFMPDTGIGKLIAAEMAARKRPKSCETIVLDNLETIMECVCGGLGFTLLPEVDIHRYQKPGVKKLRRAGLPSRVLVLVTARHASVAKRASALAKLLDGL